MKHYKLKKSIVLIIALAAVIAICGNFIKVRVSYAQTNVLSDAMALMNAQKFGEAKKMLKDAIQKDPANELLWVSYDSCIRSEMAAPGANAQMPSKNENSLSDDKIKAASGKTSGAAQNGPEIETGFATLEVSAAGDRAQPAAAAEKEIDCAILEADFSKGSAAGDLACLLNDTFKFINTDGGSYLMAGPKDKYASVSFSFKIAKFPKKVKLILNHRVVKKDRFLSAVPVLIDLNENKVNYDSVKLGNKLDSTEYDITNLSKTGANILALSVENSKIPYLLKNVKVLLYFKD